jgi:hypothetical protein
MVAIMAAGSANADIKPVLRMEFHVQENNLDEVKEILTRYAKKEGFTVDDIGPRMPRKHDRTVFYVILQRGDSERVTVTNFLERDQVLLGFYTTKQDAQSVRVIDPLIADLREKWPDIHVYTGP